MDARPDADATTIPGPHLGELVAEHLPAAAFRLDLEGRVVEANRALADLLAASSRSTLVGERLADLTTTPDEVRTWCASLRHGKDRQRTRVRFRHGPDVPVVLMGAPVRDTAGRTVGFAGLALDLASADPDLQTLLDARDPFLGAGSGSEVRRALAEASEEANVGTLLASLDRDLGDLVVSYVNEPAARMLGRSVDDLVGTPLDDVLPGLRDRAHDEGAVEVTVPRDGGPDTVLEVGLARADLWGAPAAVAFLRDVTDQRLRQRALEQREESLRQFFENTPVGFYRTTPAGEILEANPALLEMLGYDDLEHLRELDLETQGYLGDRTRRDWRERLEAQGTLVEEATWLDAEGEEVHIRESARVVRDADGEIRYYEGSVEDLTGLVEAQEVLQRESERQDALRRILESAQATRSMDEVLAAIAEVVVRVVSVPRGTILMVDPDDGVLEVRAEHDRTPDGPAMLGARLAPARIPELEDRWRSMREDPRPMVLEGLVDVLPEDLAAPLEATGVRRSLVVPLRPRNELVGLIALPVDAGDEPLDEADMDLVADLGRYASLAVENVQLVDRLRTTAAELEASNQELDDFASTLAHDLKEPVRSVEGFMAILQRRYMDALPEDGREMVDLAADASGRMRELISTLLEYARITSRGAELERVDLEQAIEDVAGNLARALSDEEGELTWDDGLPAVEADRAQLMQVLQNLVSNALRYRSEAPPRVHVSGRRRGEMVEVTVEDNGIGMDEDDQERAFRIFQQGADAVGEGAPGEEGLGMGLALCRRIVERHGGSIDVESTPGEGSTFRFTLPSADDGGS